MTDDQRREAAVAVATWIEEEQGREAANIWVWECTPMPVGLPEDDQLENGFRVALGELPIRELQARTYREMGEAMAEYHRNNSTDMKGHGSDGT